MATTIDKNKSIIDIYGWTHEKVHILELKRWVDTQIEKGANTVTLDIYWGRYKDIDSLEIRAEE
jgi:hypothetical protein